jgi:hypothetical protein
MNISTDDLMMERLQNDLKKCFEEWFLEKNTEVMELQQKEKLRQAVFELIESEKMAYDWLSFLDVDIQIYSKNNSLHINLSPKNYETYRFFSMFYPDEYYATYWDKEMNCMVRAV